MSAVNYEDLYEEFILLTSSSSSRSNGQSPSPNKQNDIQEFQEERIPDCLTNTGQQLNQQPQRVSVISTAGLSITSNSPDSIENVNAMNPEQEDHSASHQTESSSGPIMPRDSPTSGNEDEIRKVVPPSSPTASSPPRVTLNRPQYAPNNQFHMMPPHFLSTRPNWVPNQPQIRHSNVNPMFFAHQQLIYSTNFFLQQQHQQMILQSRHRHLLELQQQQRQQQKQQEEQELANSMKIRSTRREDAEYPAGLPDMWRGMPTECKKLITQQDVPDSARYRGFFTVGELLKLKRKLMARYADGGSKDDGVQNGDATADNKNASPGATENDKSDSHDHSAKKRKRSGEAGGGDDSSATLRGIVKEALDALGQEQTSGNIEPPTVVATISTRSIAVQAALAPPPPFRTAQLVFKLLQIGNNQLRSFAEKTPNKLKVIYNTQRILYECQLPIVKPQGEGMQPLRKVLTVDIAFDQISVVRFGNDKMFMKINGAPLLTVTYGAITEDGTSSPVSPEEQLLLDQIDKGQLRLSPCHQIFFINERLVHMLESQFRDHPRLRPLMGEDIQEVAQSAESSVANDVASPSK